MSDSGQILLSGATMLEFYQCYRQVAAMLPPVLRSRLNQINMTLFQAHGTAGVYVRLNGRTISQIFEEFDQQC